MNKKKLRRKLAKRLSNKMGYMGTCPNERDIILNIVLPKKDRYTKIIHCNTDCWNTDCLCHKSHEDIKLPPPR